MTIADKLALLEQTKEAQRVKLGLPESLPFSRYHEFFGRIFHINDLFANGEQGVWFDPSDLSTMFQDSTGATPVTKDGDPVGLIKDKSGNGNHATQETATRRPVYRTDGILHWLEFDGTDDYLATNGGVSIGSEINVFSSFYTQSTDKTGVVFQLASRGVGLLSPADSGAHNISLRKRLTGNTGAFDTAVGNKPPRVMVVRGSVGATNVKLETNKVEVIFTDSNPLDTDGVLTIAATNALSANFHGKAYALVIVTNAVSVDNSNAAEIYLESKAGVTL